MDPGKKIFLGNGDSLSKESAIEKAKDLERKNPGFSLVDVFMMVDRDKQSILKEAIDSSAESNEYEVYFRNNATGSTSSKPFFGISLNDVENQAVAFIKRVNSQGANDLELVDIHSVEHDDEEAGIEEKPLASQYRNFSSEFGG
jgi:vesicle coat complex subunit